jgi:inorganic pyrophosphatase
MAKTFDKKHSHAESPNHALHQLDPGPECPGVVRMIVEIPRNSHNKYEYDTDLNAFRLDRALYSPIHYPGDYGFIPGTMGGDGDPLDILTLVDEPGYPGIIMDVRPVGVLQMKDQNGPDEKILAVSHRDPRFDQIRTISDVFPHNRREIEHFFAIYKELEGKHTKIGGWQGPEHAYQQIREARSHYLTGQKTRSRTRRGASA